MKEIGRVLPIPRIFKVYIQALIIKFLAGKSITKPNGVRFTEYFHLEFSKAHKNLTIIDGQTLNGPDLYRGIGRYTLRFVTALALTYTDKNFLILITNVRMDDYTDSLIDEINRSNIQNLRISIVDIFENEALVSLDAANSKLNNVVKELNSQFLVVPSFFGDSREVFPINPPNGTRQLGILHDLIPLYFQKEYLPSARTKNSYLKNLERLRNSNYILSVSNFSMKDFKDRFGASENMIVIGGASIFEKSLPEGPSFDCRHGVMCIAGSGVSKNIERFVWAYCKLPRELRKIHPLLIVGKINFKQQLIFRLIAGFTNSKIIYYGFVTDSKLEQIYRSSRVLVIPSLAEGLSLPVYEMWSNGGVVLGGRNTAVQETLNCDEAVFDVENFDDFEKLLSKALTENQFWSYLQRKGQLTLSTKTWSNVAESVAHIFS